MLSQLIFDRGNQSAVPPSFLDMDASAEEARRAEKLEGLYHKGQDRAWNGRQVLAELIEKYDGVQLPAEHREAIRSLFAVILWGELAAWRVSAALAERLDDFDAKMAATQQAHDEARHFYVMRDYLAQIGPVPKSVGKATNRLLMEVLNADTPAKMLVGMQLVIEPLALTLFSIVRKMRFEPVLADLMRLYEKDEARHVALGVLYLPRLLQGMSKRERAQLFAWQLKLYPIQFAILDELRDDFEALGISAREVLLVGRRKQVDALIELTGQVGEILHLTQLVLRIVDIKAEISFPANPASGKRRRMKNAYQMLRRPLDEALAS